MSSKNGKLPINQVNFFSYAFISWLSSLVWKLYRNKNVPMTLGDIWETSDEESVRVNTKRLTRLWTEELASTAGREPSMFRVWRRFIQKQLLKQLGASVMVAICQFCTTVYLLHSLVEHLESVDSDIGQGLGLVAGFAVSEVTRVVTLSLVMVIGSQTGIKFRSAFMGIMYDKLLKLRVMKAKTISEIINVFSTDSYRVFLSTQTIMFFLMCPVYILIAVGYCYWLIGPWCFVAVGTFLVCFQSQVWMLTALQTLRKRCLRFTDARVRRMGEILNSMKFIKMYAWEKPFYDAVNEDRQQEQKYLFYSAIVSSIVNSIVPVTSTIATIVTVVAYNMAGNTLTASKAFALVGAMTYLRIMVAVLPFTLRQYQEAKTSLNRIKGLLLLEEYEKPSQDCKNKANAIEINNATFLWNQNESAKDETVTMTEKQMENGNSTASSGNDNLESFKAFTLSDITINITKGRLVGICGSVGAGKSSLMSAILGRMPMVDGRLAIGGTVAHVAQQAVIVNATLKENILFGRDYNMKRYMAVIKTCALEPDIELLANGDDTEIGERGVNLSGGQKQRMSLARAVYSDSDVYLLDDPLSAVDTRVGSFLFHDCFKQTLAGKTVLFVTHQLQYLKHCDEVVVMEKGTVTDRGGHEELLKRCEAYTRMFDVFERTTMKRTDKEKETVGQQLCQSAASLPVKTPEPRSFNYGSIAGNGSLKATDGKTNGRLIRQEQMSTGSVSWDAYRSYMMAAGGFLVVGVVLFMYLLSQASVIFADWWLSEWISSTTDQPASLHTFVQESNFTFESNSTNASSYIVSVIRSMNIGVTTPTLGNVTLTTVSMEKPDQGDAGSLLGNVAYNTFLYVYASSILGILFLQSTKGFAGAKAMITASNGMHKKCLQNVLKAKMAFFDANPAGRILNRFSKDQDEGDVFIPQATENLLLVLATCLLSILMIAVVTPWVLIAIVFIVVGYAVIKIISRPAMLQLKRLENIVRSPLLSHVFATSNGLSAIIAYEQQGRFSETFEKLGDISSTSLLLFDFSMRWISVRLDLCSCLLTIVLALIIVLTRDHISPAQAGLVLNLTSRVVGVMPILIRFMNDSETRFTSIERLNEYAKHLPTEPQHAANIADPDWPAEGKVEFCNVVMAYRPDMEPVLKRVSFTFEPRQKIGVVGRTGAGKSSLAASLFRLVEMTSGQIKVDGEDISKLHLGVIRSKISTIVQDPVLFAGSLRYNIDPLCVHTDDAIWDALERVNMKEKLDEVEGGLSMRIEENGENFSVGERQLICLARAVLRNSKILLLDEATANIDTSTDAMIQYTIRNCFKDCTVITIAHRLNTVLHSDKIVVMEAGQVVEFDSPQVLLSDRNSFLNRMIAAQSERMP